MIITISNGTHGAFRSRARKVCSSSPMPMNRAGNWLTIVINSDGGTRTKDISSAVNKRAKTDRTVKMSV